jgi:catechol 2,3-dioxygenase-like lactoylglutathione lyase family enzyme
MPSMIDHTAIRVLDLRRSKAFYSKALAPLGYVLLHSSGSSCGFGERDCGGDPGGDFWLQCGEPYQPRTHVAFRASSREAVAEFHSLALAGGGVNAGGPGLRPHYHPTYYAAFVLDPDGYNIEAVNHAG